MKIKLVCVGNLKDKFFIDACNEYIKRLKRFCDLTVLEITEARIPENASAKEIQQGLEKEAEAVLKQLGANDYKIALCVEGEQLDSVQFAKAIERQGELGKSAVAFVIGSSEGLSEIAKSACDLRLSFSKMTLPHRLMRVVLLEQIYRAFKIIKGEGYHK